MRLPQVPAAVPWRDGMVLEPRHFQTADQRAAQLAHMAGMAGEPWPWGFVYVAVDEVSLASSELRIECEGVMPDGTPFVRQEMARMLPTGEDGDTADFNVQIAQDGALVLSPGGDAPAAQVLPVGRLGFHAGVWSQFPEWSPPAYLLGTEHPMRADMAQQLGALAGLAAGFVATLRLPGSAERPAARVMGQVAGALAQGVGVLEALLASPAVSPGRLGIEALRLALAVRAGTGVFEQLDAPWDPMDQRGSMRRLLYEAESTASGVGLPFVTTVFRQTEENMLVAEGMPLDSLLLAIEASRPADLVAARAWLEGAALAAPERVEEAFARRVGGCRRQPIERDPRLGVASGPLLALYQVQNDTAWRGTSTALALTAATPPPARTTFSVFIPKDVDAAGQPALLPAPRRGSSYASASWAGTTGAEGGGSQ